MTKCGSIVSSVSMYKYKYEGEIELLTLSDYYYMQKMWAKCVRLIKEILKIKRKNKAHYILKILRVYIILYDLFF